ncbi:MAG: oligosaccharide flippase family protein [Ignavibacteriales bacterium]|nr:oligosaccharide flippase family protein [Ignavibacteriales bacterium]
MFEQIKRLGTDTAIYGISTVLARLLNFALIPLYTNILTTAEYGIVANIYSYIAFITIFYSYGMESSYFRFASSKEVGDEKDNFSTPFIAITSASIILSVLMIACADPLTSVFQIDISLYTLLYYTSGILFFDALALVPYAALRLQRKAMFFASTKVLNIVLTIILNIVTVYYLRWGIEGIFFSNLAASVFSFLILAPSIIRQFNFKFHSSLYKELLKFGLPLVPVSISGVLLQIVDRPILKLLMGDSAVGIYQANYRLGIFMALITGMFEYAWRPFFLSHTNDPNAKQLFSRVMTYYLLICSAVFLALSFFLENIIQYKFFGRYILPPPYWEGLSIVPLVLLSYIMSGIGTNLNAGIQIEKKTAYLLPTSLAGSASKIIMTFLLVPQFGIMGAAIATLIGYAMLEITLYPIVQKFYHIEYEFVRIGKLILSAAVAFSIIKIFDASVALKFITFGGWMISLFVIGFFTKGEMNRMRQAFGKIS